MVSSSIYDEMEISNVANETQHMEYIQKMVQMTADQNTFTGNKPKPKPSEPPTPIEAIGPIAFHDDSETTNGSSFKSNSETIAPNSEAGTQATDIFSEVQLLRRRGEALVNDAHILNHKAMIARTQGDYATADKYQKEANAAQKEGYDIIERLQAGNMNSGSDIPFGSLSLSPCQKACAKKADGYQNTYILGHH